VAGDRDAVELYLEGVTLPPERLEGLAREVEGVFRRYLECGAGLPPHRGGRVGSALAPGSGRPEAKRELNQPKLSSAVATSPPSAGKLALAPVAIYSLFLGRVAAATIPERPPTMAPTIGPVKRPMRPDKVVNEPAKPKARPVSVVVSAVPTAKTPMIR